MPASAPAAMRGANEARIITESTFNPPMNGLSAMNMVADMPYLGPLPAGNAATPPGHDRWQGYPSARALNQHSRGKPVPSARQAGEGVRWNKDFDS
jgi:hypothetical protein